MRAEVTLRMDGTSRVVSIPRPILTYLGWITGDRLIVELLENKSVNVRLFTPADIPPRGRGRIVYDFASPVEPT